MKLALPFRPSRLASLAVLLLAVSPLAPAARAVPQDCSGTGTAVPGGNVFGGTWDSAGSPYRVMGDLNVNGLTITEGVCVIMEGNYEFKVLACTAAGTAANPIRFTAANTSQGWKGILISNTGGTLVFEHCIIEYGNQSGMRIIDSVPTITSCTFQSNRTILSQGGGRGGGLFADLSNETSDLALVDCTFRSNLSFNDSVSTGLVEGGGLWVKMRPGHALLLDGCLVLDNVAEVPISGSFCGTETIGGGLVLSGDACLTNCTFSGNVAHAMSSCAGGGPTARGGGAYLANGSALVANCRFLGNIASTWSTGAAANIAEGGALYCTSGSIDVTNCVLGCNSTRAVCDLGGTVDVCSGSMNGAGGAGLFVDAGSTGTVTNCTIVRNSRGEGFDTVGPGVTTEGTTTVLNSILWYNDSGGTQVDTQGSGTVTVTYSDVQNGFAGIGNITDDPGLPPAGCDACDFDIPNPATGAFSPCVDAGDPSSVHDDPCFPPSFGMARNDMGARGGPGACDWCAPGVPTNYCIGAPNSTGPGASMSWSGSTSVSNNDLVLGSTGCPPGQFGLFYFACHRQDPPIVLGNGFRCVAGNFTRLPVVVVDGSGVATYALDYPSLPVSGAIAPGDIWHFQFWYRDIPAGGAEFNLSDGLEIPFCM